MHDGTRSKLPLRTDVANHSPTGHEWGYGGSGPAQLALDLLLDATHDDERFHELADRLGYSDAFGNLTPAQTACRRVKQRFLATFTSRFDDEWFLAVDFVRGWAYGAISVERDRG